jgi:hypothetical protein
LCKKAKIPVNKEAPDFVVMTTGAPQLDVVRIMEDPYAEEQEVTLDGDPSALFQAVKEALEEPTAEAEKKPARKGKVAKGKKK